MTTNTICLGTSTRGARTKPSLTPAKAAGQSQLRADAWNAYIERITKGDADALARLYDESKSLVYGLALRILGDPADAEEVTLDVYTQVWRSAQGFDPQRGAATPWLVMLTRSRAIDRTRSRSARHREEPLPEVLALAATGKSPEEASALAQQRRRVQAALQQLTPAQREAIELAFFEGLTHSELAVRLGQPLGTIKTRIRLALMRLRAALESPAPIISSASVTASIPTQARLSAPRPTHEA